MMIIRSKGTRHVPSSEITPEDTWLNRRSFLGASAAFLGAPALVGAKLSGARTDVPALLGPHDLGGRGTQEDELTPIEDVTGYNNFYEFGLDKRDPAKNAHTLQPSPWSITVDGLCENPAEYQLEDFIGPSNLEDRVYRLRCVEGWSMVIPWQGFPLADVIRRAAPTGDAKYISFETLWDPAQMPERRWVPRAGWPYREGLRLDEAQHPLALLATGLYGKTLPNQNGAPLRLVVPWKYGFKSIKSIVRMTFTSDEPLTTWSSENPREYGFYSNVNPDVDHPRWSQARERRIGELRRRPTMLFNGYDEVAGLYSGMDLRRYI